MLTENENHLVSNHLAHNLQTHEKHYKLQEASITLAKVSKLLVAVEDGKVAEYVGKGLEEIDVSGK